MASDGGKGSTPRPRSIADDEWANRWNAIFGRDNIDEYKKSEDVNKYKQLHTKEEDGLDIRSGDVS
jgi:hypothetical protein